MSKIGRGPGRHSGRTASGNTRDVKIKRIGNVTIYRRGTTYSLYYRENGKSVRRKVDGNLAVAEATAGKILQSLAEKRATEFAYELVSPRVLIAQFLDYGETVRKHSIGTIDR